MQSPPILGIRIKLIFQFLLVESLVGGVIFLTDYLVFLHNDADIWLGKGRNLPL